MRLKLYRAPCITDAMAQLRAELGADALILSTRRVAGGVELTAATEPEAAAPAAPPAAVAEPHRAAALDFHNVPAGLRGELSRGGLPAALAARFAFAPLDLGADAAPVLLAGPPGAGKTLTAARLATRLVMGGVAPMVITADGRRAGATEQLAAFTRLLGLSLLVAGHPVTLGRALLRRTGGAPVLIDAPGHDPFDPAQRDELAALAGTAGARVVLVLPAGLDPGEAADLAGAFAQAGAVALIATRFDLARRVGGVLAAAAGGLALAEAGIGPGAADGLAPLDAEFLAARLADTLPLRSRSLADGS